MAILVTGAAGFIGSHVCRRLLARKQEVIGLDNLNAYYDVRLKQARLARLRQSTNFSFVAASVEDSPALQRVFAQAEPVRVVHLAAQAACAIQSKSLPAQQGRAPCLRLDQLRLRR